MTKLCDLGPNDGVCSVQWTKEGSYISVVTSAGKVQVRFSLSYHSNCSLFRANDNFCFDRFGMGHNVKRFEPWVDIKQELVC